MRSQNSWKIGSISKGRARMTCWKIPRFWLWGTPKDELIIFIPVIGFEWVLAVGQWQLRAVSKQLKNRVDLKRKGQNDLLKNSKNLTLGYSERLVENFYSRNRIWMSLSCGNSRRSQNSWKIGSISKERARMTCWKIPRFWLWGTPKDELIIFIPVIGFEWVLAVGQWQLKAVSKQF